MHEVKAREEMYYRFFDYSGHSITKYTLDTISNPFDVDEENRIIYNYNSEFFEDSFLKFTFLVSYGLRL